MGELSELGQAAVWYCEHGFGIIPLKARTKQPATVHGLNDWFDNPESAREVWTKFPDFNIGIVCGAPSHGLLVLDFDIDKEREKDGYATLSAWERAQGDLPETSVAITGSGGMHYLYRTDRSNIRPSANAELGVDVRCDGSYIVAPPSIHPNGNRYEWQDHPEDVPIATANGAVYDFLDHVQRNGGKDETLKDNGKFKLPEKIESKRNVTLHKYASHLRAIGRSDEEIMITVMGANYTRCQPPLEAKEVQSIVRSACRYERGDSSDREGIVGRPGSSSGGSGGQVQQFRTDKGRIIPNELAKAIIELNHARIIDGAPAVWTGKRWEFGKRAIGRVSRSYADDITKSAKDEVYEYIADCAEEVSSDTSFDGSYYVQFADCTWDVMNGETVEPTPDMFIIATLPIPLDIDAPFGLADQFIYSLADGDSDTIKAMCEIVGACMCNRRILAQSPMLIGKAGGSGGEAANGKSTFIKAVQNLLGAGNYSSLDIATLGQRFQAGRVIGKLANLGDDIPNGFLRGDELSVFKKLVTGEQIYTDVKNSEGFEFRPSATMVFSMNSMPRLADTTDGVFRRLAFIPFRRKFIPGAPDFDPDMDKHMARTENMQRLAVLGLMALPELIARGKLTEIPDMLKEIENVRTDNDGVRRWVFDQGIEISELAGRWVSSVYQDYSTWCDNNGENALRTDSFLKRLLDTFGPLEAYATRDRTLNIRGKRLRIRKDGELSE